MATHWWRKSGVLKMVKREGSSECVGLLEVEASFCYSNFRHNLWHKQEFCLPMKALYVQCTLSCAPSLREGYIDTGFWAFDRLVVMINVNWRMTSKSIHPETFWCTSRNLSGEGIGKKAPPYTALQCRSCIMRHDVARDKLKYADDTLCTVHFALCRWHTVHYALCTMHYAVDTHCVLHCCALWRFKHLRFAEDNITAHFDAASNVLCYN